MCIWKSWKRVKMRIANLIKCGIDKYQAYMWGNSRLGYWRVAGSYILCRAITNEKLICYIDGFIPRMVPKIGTAVCVTACTMV